MRCSNIILCIICIIISYCIIPNIYDTPNVSTREIAYIYLYIFTLYLADSRPLEISYIFCCCIVVVIIIIFFESLTFNNGARTQKCAACTADVE